MRAAAPEVTTGHRAPYPETVPRDARFEGVRTRVSTDRLRNVNPQTLVEPDRSRVRRRRVEERNLAACADPGTDGPHETRAESEPTELGIRAHGADLGPPPADADAPPAIATRRPSTLMPR